jgi:hypothetical protein
MMDLLFMNSFFPAKYLVGRTFIGVIVVVANYVLSPARIEAKKVRPYEDFIIALYLDLQKRRP